MRKQTRQPLASTRADHRTGLPLLSPQHSNVRLVAEIFSVNDKEINFDIMSGCESHQEIILFLEPTYFSKQVSMFNDMNSVHTMFF